MMGLRKSIRRLVGSNARATMSSAPAEPKKADGFLEPFLCQVHRQAYRPFMS